MDINDILEILRKNNVYKFKNTDFEVEFFQGADPINPIVQYNKEISERNTKQEGYWGVEND